MHKRSIVASLIVAALVLGVCWLWNKGTFMNFSNTEQTRPVTGNGETSGQLPDKGDPKTLDDLLAQAEETQLPKVDTTGWQTYRDEKLGIEFTYPKGWVVKTYGEDAAFHAKICVKTIDERYGKMPSSSAQSGQGDECVFQVDKPKINEQSLVSEILQHKKNGRWSDGQLSRVEQSYFLVPILMTLSEDDTRFYIKSESSIVSLRVWNMDRKFKGVDEALYGILQTLKPIQK